MGRAAEGHGFRLVGHHDLDGYGDGMQVQRAGDALYVGHFGPSGMGTSILDVSDVTAPRMVRQWRAPEGTHTHKVQVADGLLLVNHEFFRGGDVWSEGLAVYSLEDPFDPQQVGWWSTGNKGVHRIVYMGGRYAYMSAIPTGFDDRIWVIVDLEDPTAPKEVGRWWWPGQREDEERTWPEDKRYAAHHAMVDGDRAYLGYNDAGMVILDISDPTTPTPVSFLTWEGVGDTHTCMPLPGRDLLVVTDEEIHNKVAHGMKQIRIVDISDERNPSVVTAIEPPAGDFATRGLRFGPHNLHENRPGSYRSAEVVFATLFNAGLRVYDLADPEQPREIAHYIPELPDGQEDIQSNDVFVADDGLVYLTDRAGAGVDILEPSPELRDRMEEARL